MLGAHAACTHIYYIYLKTVHKLTKLYCFFDRYLRVPKVECVENVTTLLVSARTPILPPTVPPDVIALGWASILDRTPLPAIFTNPCPCFSISLSLSLAVENPHPLFCT